MSTAVSKRFSSSKGSRAKGAGYTSNLLFMELSPHAPRADIIIKIAQPVSRERRARFSNPAMYFRLAPSSKHVEEAQRFVV